MTHEYLIWILVAAYALHILEEHTFNLNRWAQKTFGLSALDSADFYLTNAMYLVVTAIFAHIGWQVAFLALGIPAGFMMNGLFFHLINAIRTRTYSPGMVTGTVFYLPLGVLAYYGAYLDGQLSAFTFMGSLCVGGFLSAYLIILQKLKIKFNA